nr:fatty-acid amide hydrolase 2-A isoform X1 [Parasteatoda tepidariorum]XP_042907651.1 fatty-acid amide hydrolase 2-A isoform X2 [Parasteatoda tepidariorum]
MSTILVFVRVVLILTRPIFQIVLKYIYRIFMGRTKPVPPISHKVLLMSATDIADKIRKKQLKCEDVMRAYINRIRLVEPYINAVVDERYDEALEDARRVDRFLESGEKTVAEIERDEPLLGVPFTCKESIGVKGLSQTAGIYEVKDRKAENDSDAAGFYRAAGAIPVTVTNVPERCMWWDSANHIYGITKNPFDHSRTPGGSTGGEGALLTTGGAVIGIGSDVGGSIRMPSSFNGIYGHKPTAEVVSNVGKYPYHEVHSKKVDHISCTGPMCRYIEDLPLLLKILSENDQRLQLENKVDFHKVKVYYIEEFPDIPADPAIKQAIRKAAHFFEEQYNIKAIPLKLPELKNALDMWQCKLLETDIPPFKLCLAHKDGKTNLLLELLKNIFHLSHHTLHLIYYSMIEIRERDQRYYDLLRQYGVLEKKFQEIFKEDSVLLVPTHPEPPPFYHLTIPNLVNVGYTAIFNVLGFPATTIPAGMCDGLPIGIQAVSGHFKDRLTISTGMELDKLFGGWITPGIPNPMPAGTIAPVDRSR